MSAKSAADAPCFHCGLPLDGSTLEATVDDRREPVCCTGCLAVAELIAGAGLDDYYRYRAEPGQRPVATEDPWDVFERSDIAARFTTVEAGATSAALAIDGLRCTACSWLIERVLSRMAGVSEVSVNAATGRAHVRWDASRTTLAAVLRAIAQLGYRPHPVTDGTLERVKLDESRTALKRLAVAGFGMMQVMMFAIADYSAELGGERIDPGIWSYFRLVSLLVTTPVLFYAGAPILTSAWRSLQQRTIGMDVPVGIALVLAYAASVLNTWRDAGNVYYDSVTMFVFFLTLGRWVEMTVRHRTADINDALARHLPSTAHRVVDGTAKEVATAQLATGDVILVLRGEVVPADAVALDAEAHLDEAMLTGESLPVCRRAGERICAGTLNVGNAFRAKVAAVGNATVLSGIVALLLRSQAQKPRLARVADRAAAHFLRVVLVTAGLAGIAWMVFDPSRAFAATLAMLVVACPCAFAIAMPAALAAASGELARHGVLVTRPDAIEGLARLDHVIFDKTGTLTEGKLQLERTETLASRSATDCTALAAALEVASEHPIARAFDDVRTAVTATAIESIPGAGVQGTIAGKRYRLGTYAFATAHLNGRLPPPQPWSGTVVTLADEEHVLAEFLLSDALRPGSRGIAQALGGLSIASEILSGDGLQSVTDVAQRCGIDGYRARCSPEQKLQRLRALQARGRKVGMIGDGINDAPVLGAADVSIAMGTGAALAQASADIVIVGELTALPHAIRTARRTLSVARQNLYWAAAYNLAGLPLAALGFIPPWAAALGMSLSSIAVVLNATRLLRRRAFAPAADRAGTRLQVADTPRLA